MADTLNQKVVIWTMGQVGKLIQLAPGSKGECWDLAEAALKQAGAKTSSDLGPMGDDVDYVWGTPLADLKSVIPGDILQYRDYVMVTATTTKTKFKDAETSEEDEQKSEHDHHTSIVSANLGDGNLNVLEQNYLGQHEKTKENSLRWKSAPAAKSTTQEWVEHPVKHSKELATVETTVVVTVTGTIKAYRPMPK